MTDTSEPTDPAQPAKSSKLDPLLQERLDARNAVSARQSDDSPADDAAPVDDDHALSESAQPEQIEVMVALVAPPTSDDIDALADRGLTVRSTIGDILTGVVAIDAVEHLSAYEAILKIESSTPLQLEEPSDDSDSASDAAEDDGFSVNDFVE